MNTADLSAGSEAHPKEPSFFPMAANTDTLRRRFRETLQLCSKLIEAGDFTESEHKLLPELVDFLESISIAIIVNQDDEQTLELENNAFQILSEIHLFITSSSLDQAVVDALSFELPKQAAKLGGASQRCLQMAESVVESFTGSCDHREMLSILSEALASASEMFRIPKYFYPLLSCFPKVFVSMRWRQFEHVKAAVPVILNALKTISTRADVVIGDDDDDMNCRNLFHRAICIADSMKTVCVKLQSNDSKQLRALLGLFVLQTMALVSMCIKHRLSDSVPFLLHLSHLLHYCGLTYIGLIAGSSINDLLHMALGGMELLPSYCLDSSIDTSANCADDQDVCVGCFSHIWHGASLAVIWGYKWNEIAVAAEADLPALKDELQSSQTKRWEAAVMLKHVFFCANLAWELKQHASIFLLDLLDGNLSQDENLDPSTFMPSLYSALQPVICRFPTSLRFDILRALIKNSDSSSMIAVLLDCVKEEMLAENNKITPDGKLVLNAGSGSFQGSCFWSASVLELVELVLRPPEGGPPSLPEHCDAVLSVLNLYRFILITESTGSTNHTGVLSKDCLKKAYSDWLLPLRTLVTGMVAENNKDYDQLASEILCGLNPVELGSAWLGYMGLDLWFKVK